MFPMRSFSSSTTRSPAPAEDVFGAYLDPELLVRWYGPAGWHVRPTDVVVEPVVGGMQRLSMINEVDPSVSCILQSRFLSIEPFKELEYAEQLPDHLGNPGSVLVYQRHRFFPETVITADGVGSGTRIVIEIGPMPASVHEEVRTTWRSTFARLDDVLATRAHGDAQNPPRQPLEIASRQKSAALTNRFVNAALVFNTRACGGGFLLGCALPGVSRKLVGQLHGNDGAATIQGHALGGRTDPRRRPASSSSAPT